MPQTPLAPGRPPRLGPDSLGRTSGLVQPLSPRGNPPLYFWFSFRVHKAPQEVLGTWVPLREGTGKGYRRALGVSFRHFRWGGLKGERWGRAAGGPMPGVSAFTAAACAQSSEELRSVTERETERKTECQA